MLPNAVEDPSSILGAFTSLGLIGPRTDSKCLRRPELRGCAARTARVERRTPVVTAGETASSNGQERQRNTRACPMSCSPLRPRIEGGSPSGSAHRNQSVRSAQQQENATRLASVALSVTGSAAARPDSIARAV
jgi:hypothetical protein